MWKWAAAAAFLLLVSVLWMTRGSGTARAPRAQTQEVPATLSAPPATVPGSETPTPAMAHGVVVDEQDHPIAGALVRWRQRFDREGGLEACTGADGVFTFQAASPPDGVYVAEARGFAGQTVLAGSERIVMRRGSLSVRARVVDEEQRPVEGATGEVFLCDAYGRSVTGAEGALEIAGLFPYSQTPGGLIVRADGYVPEALLIGALLDEDVDMGVIALSHGGIVRGVVRDEATGRPVAGACVRYASDLWLDGFTMCDAPGSFRFCGVPLDAQWLYAHADGYLPGQQGWLPSVLDRYDRRVFPDGEREIVLDLTVVRCVAVRGVVVDRAGAPVAGASVSVDEQEPSPRELVPGLMSRATTDARGAFAVGGFYPGTALRIVAASESGFVTSEVRAGEGGIVLRLEPTRRVAGRVVNGRGEPAAEAELRIRRPGDDEHGADATWERCDEDGRFAFEHVRPGPWDLLVGAKGLVTLEKTIEVADGKGEVDLGDIVLGSGNFVAGQVVDPVGLPIEGARVSATSEDERPGGERFGSAPTDSDGRFRIEGLHDGDFEVEVWERGRCFARTSATAGRSDLRLVMQASLTVRGRVLGGGKPLAHAQLGATGGDADLWTGPDGLFEVKEIVPGEPFSLRISHALYKSLSLEAVEPWKDVRDFTLAEGRTFEGTVVDERGLPLPDMSVEVYALGATGESWEESYSDRRVVKSDARGQWRVGGLAEGRVVVQLGTNLGYAHEEPVEVAPGVASCQLVARKGFKIHGSVRRKDGRAVEEASVTVHRADGSEVSVASGSQLLQYSRFSTTELPAGRYKLVVSGSSEGLGGVPKEQYGEVTVEVRVPGPDVEIVLPK